MLTSSELNARQRGDPASCTNQASMALKLLLLLAAASTASASSLHGGPQPLRRRTNQPKDQSSLAVKAIHRVRGGSTGGLDYRFFVAGSISAALSHGYTTDAPSLQW